VKETHRHAVINYIRTYVEGNIHTNTIENFWSLLKRGIMGSFHKVSIQHLPKYLAEFEYRFNHREAQNLFAQTLGIMLRREGMRYSSLVVKI